MPLLAALAVLVSMLALGGRAEASCVPMPLSQKIDGAFAIVTGTVAGHENGDPRRLIVDVEAVHKGSLQSSRITVLAGPDVPGASGTQVATSVDYVAAVGTRHTLYLHWEAPAYRTDACTGSHEGSPTAEERAAFASLPTRTVAGTQGTPPSQLPTTSTDSNIAWLGLAAVGISAAAFAARRIRAR